MVVGAARWVGPAHPNLGVGTDADGGYPDEFPGSLRDHSGDSGTGPRARRGRVRFLSATINSVGSSDQLHVLGETVHPVMTAAMGSSIEICDMRGPAGAGPPAHRHPWEEIYLVIEGIIEINVDVDSRRLGPGSVAHVPANTVHSLRNVTEAHFLTITTMGNAIRFFSTVSDQFGVGEPDLDDLIRIAEDHDIQILA